jgi:hypothetical protein
MRPGLRRRPSMLVIVTQRWLVLYAQSAPVLGRHPGSGVFPRHLRVPPMRPAEHYPHRYRRGKPNGQADQHPPPQAHPNPTRHISNRTRAVSSTHHTTSDASALRPSPPWRPDVTRPHRGRYHTSRQPGAAYRTPPYAPAGAPRRRAVTRPRNARPARRPPGRDGVPMVITTSVHIQLHQGHDHAKVTPEPRS